MNFVIDLMGNILFFIVCLGVTIAMVLFFCSVLRRYHRFNNGCIL